MDKTFEVRMKALVPFRIEGDEIVFTAERNGGSTFICNLSAGTPRSKNKVLCVGGQGGLFLIG